MCDVREENHRETQKQEIQVKLVNREWGINIKLFWIRQIIKLLILLFWTVNYDWEWTTLNNDLSYRIINLSYIKLWNPIVEKDTENLSIFLSKRYFEFQWNGIFEDTFVIKTIEILKNITFIQFQFPILSAIKFPSMNSINFISNIFSYR